GVKTTTTTTSLVRRGCAAYRSGAGIDCCGGHEISRLPETCTPTHPRPRLLHSVIGKARDAAGGTRPTATLRPGKAYTATPQPPPDGYVHATVVQRCQARASVTSNPQAASHLALHTVHDDRKTVRLIFPAPHAVQSLFTTPQPPPLFLKTIPPQRRQPLLLPPRPATTIHYIAEPSSP
ncbi:unnamed protein product, partial [Ectocarpus sp. 13 AM-2016]